MAKGVSPLSYRLGFSRVWDSLFTHSFYINNYNFFYKSQLLNHYIDGFFKKWTWNKRRSYYLNFLYSHTEINWSFGYLNLVVYFYMTGFDLINFSVKKNLFYKLKNNKLLFDRSNFFVSNLLNFFYYNSLLFKAKQIFNPKDYNIMIRYFKKFSRFRVYKEEEKLLFLHKIYRDRKISWKLRGNLKNFFFNFLSKRLYNRYYGNKKLTNVIKFGHYLRYTKMLWLGKKGKPLLIFFKFFIFLNKLIKYGFYKSYINFIYYYFIMHPFLKVFRRYFFKDLFYLLGLNFLKNFQKKVSVSFIKLNHTALTSSAYSKHIWLKLKKKYTFGSIIYSLMRTIKRGKFFAGMFFDCNGRFTKKQKAWHKAFYYGKMPFSKQSGFLDSSIVSVTLRYGVGSIKININYV